MPRRASKPDVIAEPMPTGAPSPGWKSEPLDDVQISLDNPRPPAVPQGLIKNLEQYYTACALMGVLSAQKSEPNREWLTDLACDIGEQQAKKARARWP